MFNRPMVEGQLLRMLWGLKIRLIWKTVSLTLERVLLEALLSKLEAAGEVDLQKLLIAECKE